ncbi:MAG: myosin-crossreactive antigen [Halioglobus sp.]|jgi:myosin-crossreactive antigen
MTARQRVVAFQGKQLSLKVGISTGDLHETRQQQKPKGFVVRGGRMHEMHYECYWELLSHIPSLEDPNISVRNESYEFNERFISNGQARLLKNGEKLDVSSYGLSFGQKKDFVKLTYVSEKSLGDKRIEDWFDQAFFDTKFWYIWSSMFAFQKWSSLAEMRRYMKRFMHLVDGLPRLGGVMRTKYNQYDSVVRPMKKYLEEKGVAFGNPGPFCNNIDLQKWYSFTATMKDNTFLDYMENFSGNVDGTGGLVTLTDSNWLMSIVIARQPHFPQQADDVAIFWGYGLYPDRKGNYIDKTMAECTGAEMLEELYYHLKIQDLMKPVTEAGKVNCIPVAMPFIDSLFMPRTLGDRPDVIPEGSTNFAFLGQFAEAPKDCVFTVEYSVRTAQMAVYGLFDTDKKVHPMYESTHNPQYLLAALKAISR